MDKNERKQLRRAAQLQRLAEALEAPSTGAAPTLSPLGVTGAQIAGPKQASSLAQDGIRRAAANGTAGTGRPVSTLFGAAKQNAMEAIIGGGTIANGGGGRAAAGKALRSAGRSAAASSLAATTALVLCDVAMQVGPALTTALVRAEMDVRAAARADRDRGDAEA